MSAYPSASELLRAVSQFLRDDVLPQAKGSVGFNLRVSINAIDLVRRQLDHGAMAEQIEREGLEALLGETDAPPPDLRRQLATMIGRNEIAADSEALLDHLRKTAIAQLAIDQPRYSALVAALEAGETPWRTIPSA